MDFTVTKYRELLTALKRSGRTFQTFEEALKFPKTDTIILRHDVDLLPHNSLAFAQIQADNGIRGVYYFRAVPESWDEIVIKTIHNLGHEIGYHYECLSTCKGDVQAGINNFEKNLTDLRRLVPVSTICMHGSPLSRFDSKDLWKKYNYRDFGIIGEPYFDLDFNRYFYLTDTGRRWDGDKVSVRDRVELNFRQSFHSTDQVIAAVTRDQLPREIMFTFHPQRWTDNTALWIKELLGQNLKNIVKRYIISRQSVASGLF